MEKFKQQKIEDLKSRYENFEFADRISNPLLDNLVAFLSQTIDDTYAEAQRDMLQDIYEDSEGNKMTVYGKEFKGKISVNIKQSENNIIPLTRLSTEV